MVSMETQSLKLSLITADPDVQSRAATNSATVEQYAAAYASGDRLPAIKVMRDKDGRHWLYDGFHRVQAAELAGIQTIECEVKSGTRRDAMIASVGMNATHGLRRTNADKRKAVEVLLADKHWSAKSDRWIAETAKVHHQLVAKLRGEPTVSVNSSRVGQDGKTYPVKSRFSEQDQQLIESEEIIEKGHLFMFNAFKVIRNGRLYRAEFSSFEDYFDSKMDETGISDLDREQLAKALAEDDQQRVAK